jgi:TolB protein
MVSALTSTSNVHTPSLTVDGKKVVFALQSASGSEVDVVAVTGGTPSTVISTATETTLSNLREPVMSPDGTKVVFACDQGGGSALGIVNADGTGFAILAASQTFISPSFYPDGTAVLAAAGSSVGTLTSLQKITLATGMSQSITGSLGNEAQTVANRVVISPDGTHAAFDGRLGSGATRIFTIDLANPNNITHVTDYPADPSANDTFPSWQGNATVAFSSDTGGNDQVYTVASTASLTTGSLVLPSAIEPWFGPN